jgi:YHS domain-containing protein
MVGLSVSFDSPILVGSKTSLLSGKSRFASNFSGFQFWFSSEDNKQLFDIEPWRFVPAFGGFSTTGVANEPTPWSKTHLGPSVSVSATKIVNGRSVRLLFLLFSRLYFGTATTQKMINGATIDLANTRWKAW